jgi:hypothetical protein
VLDGVDFEAIRIFCLDLTDVFVGCQLFEHFEPLGEVVRHNERMKMLFELIMCISVITKGN